MSTTCKRIAGVGSCSRAHQAIRLREVQPFQARSCTNRVRRSMAMHQLQVRCGPPIHSRIATDLRVSPPPPRPMPPRRRRARRPRGPPRFLQAGPAPRDIRTVAARSMRAKSSVEGSPRLMRSGNVSVDRGRLMASIIPRISMPDRPDLALIP